MLGNFGEWGNEGSMNECRQGLFIQFDNSEIMLDRK